MTSDRAAPESALVFLGGSEHGAAYPLSPFTKPPDAARQFFATYGFPLAVPGYVSLKGLKFVLECRVYLHTYRCPTSNLNERAATWVRSRAHRAVHPPKV